MTPLQCAHTISVVCEIMQCRASKNIYIQHTYIYLYICHEPNAEPYWAVLRRVVMYIWYCSRRASQMLFKAIATARAIFERVFYLHRLKRHCDFCQQIYRKKAMTLQRLYGVCVWKRTPEREWNRFFFAFHNEIEMHMHTCRSHIHTKME